MIVLQCVNGRLRNGDSCKYKVQYRDEAAIIRDAKANGTKSIYGVAGYHCPSCKKFPLNMFKEKGPAG